MKSTENRAEQSSALLRMYEGESGKLSVTSNATTRGMEGKDILNTLERETRGTRVWQPAGIHAAWAKSGGGCRNAGELCGNMDAGKLRAGYEEASDCCGVFSCLHGGL